MTHLFKATSGIHIKPFYKIYYLPGYNIDERIGNDLEFTISDAIIRKEMKNYSIKDYNNDKEFFYDSIRDKMEGDCLMYIYAYKPTIYDEDIAHLCNLIPFKLKSYDGNLDLELLSFRDTGMDMTYKLEAYQLLVEKSYDEHSNFAKKGISYFKQYYCKNSEVLKEIKELLSNNKIAA